MPCRDHIGWCNNYDAARVVPLSAGGARIGLLRRDNAAALSRFSDVFAVGRDEVELVASGDVAAARPGVGRAADGADPHNSVTNIANRAVSVSPRLGTLRGL